jgi:hypothetical protein
MALPVAMSKASLDHSIGKGNARPNRLLLTVKMAAASDGKMDGW